jgi:hypothetical protein
MQPLALDLTSFGDDLHSGRLSPGDWPRVARDCGVSALDGPLSLLVRLDPIGRGHYLKQEMEKRGVVWAAVRDTEYCHLDDAVRSARLDDTVVEGLSVPGNERPGHRPRRASPPTLYDDGRL